MILRCDSNSNIGDYVRMAESKFAFVANSLAIIRVMTIWPIIAKFVKSSIYCMLKEKLMGLRNIPPLNYVHL